MDHVKVFIRYFQITDHFTLRCYTNKPLELFQKAFLN